MWSSQCSQSNCKVNTMPSVCIIYGGVLTCVLNINAFKFFCLCETKIFRISECVRATFGNKAIGLVLSALFVVLVLRKGKQLCQLLCILQTAKIVLVNTATWKDLGILYCS